MSQITKVEKGQIIHLRPDRLNLGEVDGSLMALESSDWGRVRCVDIFSGLPIPPQSTIRFADIERVSTPHRKGRP